MTSTKQLEPGVILAGRYRLVRLLGTGGMGQVWAAAPVSGGDEVAIKVLRAHLPDDADVRARFEREVRLMQELADASPHVTRVLDRGIVAEDVPFVVMELLGGEGLDARLKRERPMSLAAVSDVVTQLCKALEVVHAKKVVHRDLKPANIFLCPKDGGVFVKLIDFGTAKALAEMRDQTGVGQIVGTPDYMAPEQLTSEVPIGPRTDLFAVGSIVYRAATGKLPFGKGPINERTGRILSARPAKPSSIVPTLPSSFDDFVERALAKRPVDRFASAKELATELRRCVEDEEELRASGSPATPLPPAAMVRKEKPRSRALLVATLVVLGLVALALVLRKIV